MKRTTSYGNSSNRYTNGDPTTNTPATVVDASDMNMFQEELAAIVEQGAEDTLDSENENQVVSSIDEMIRRGGLEKKTVILNNTTDQDLTGLAFLNDKYRMIQIKFDLRKRTDDESFRSIGELILVWDYEAVTPAFKIEQENYQIGTDVHGLTFKLLEFDSQGGVSIDSTKVQVDSDDMAGANYLCELSVLEIKAVKK